jgi:hypothetical protein
LTGRNNEGKSEFTTHPVRNKLLIATVAAIFAGAATGHGGSIGEFLKNLGTSMSHPEKRKTPPKSSPGPRRPKTKEAVQPAEFPPAPTATPMPVPSPTPTVAQVPVRVASVSSEKNSRRDLPYAIPVPNKPGFVTSPYAPKQGLVDVRGFPSGTEVTDPYTGKTFLTP